VELPSHSQHGENVPQEDRPTAPEQMHSKALSLQRFMSRPGFTPGDNLVELSWTTTAPR